MIFSMYIGGSGIATRLPFVKDGLARLHQEAVVHIINKSYNLNYLIFIDSRKVYTFTRAGV